MTQQLYKAVLRIGNGNEDEKARLVQRVFLYGQLQNWLTEQDKRSHYVNSYYNDEALIVVLSDRNTALMLKLALQR